MPNAAQPDRARWFGPALGIVAAITAARVAVLWFSKMDLFVDEAQYWLWGQELAFGYFSKPPLIGWVIRAATELAGSDTAFWIRLPAPLLHAATALILGAIAAEWFGRTAAVAVAAAFVTLPLVAVGSLLMSTDTVMFPFLAAALWVWLRVLDDPGSRPGLALVAGMLVGVGFMAKYAAVYYVGLAALAAVHPSARPRLSEAMAAFAGFALVIAPNLLWNLRNGAPTLTHTVDNTGLAQGIALRPGEMTEFVLSQFLVFGPILFVALVLGPFRPGPQGAPRALLLWLSLPIVALVTVQALLSGANANWAAAAVLSGTLVAVPLLLRAPRWLALSFATNGALCVVIALGAVQAGSLRLWSDRPLMARYLGLDEMSRDLLDRAQAMGATAIVASERAILADLFHTGRGSRLAVRAWPMPGRPTHHYAMRFSYAGDAPGPVLAVARDGQAPPPCAPLAEDLLQTPVDTAFRGQPFRLWLVPAACWGP
jgi:4-amino-4-deoxy-L-arabinose transferase-like glycosyltransferase